MEENARRWPVSTITWRARHQPALLQDLFAADALSRLTADDRTRLAIILGTPGDCYYPHPETVGPHLMRHVMDAAVLALVDEQVGARGRTATSDCPTQSPLWAQYTLVHDAGTVMLQAAILAICRADLVETAARTGRVVIGPSTLPGAGLGAIALGLVKNDADRKTKRAAQGKWHLPYLGPLLRAEDVPVELTSTRYTLAGTRSSTASTRRASARS